MYSDEDEDDFNDNYDYEDNLVEEIPMGNEIKAFERIGFQNILLSGDRRTGIISDQERFAEKVNVYLQKYREELFTDYQLNFLLEKINSIKNVRFKNPLGYVLGYYVNDISNIGNKYINKTKFKKIKKIVKTESEVISLPDIIRYSRMWSKTE